MNKKSLIWAFTFVWLLGPVEPVFADRDFPGQFPDVVTRSPGGGAVWAQEITQQSSSRTPWGANATSQASSGPWMVEMWSGGRRRVKHFNGHNAYNSYNSDISYHPSSNYGFANNYNSGNNYNRRRNFNARNYYNGATNYTASSTLVPFAVNSPDAPGGPQQPSPWLKQSQPGQYFSSGQSQSPLRSGVASGQFSNGNNQNNYGNNQVSNAGDANGMMRKPDKFADTPQIDESGVRHFGNGRHYDLKAMPMDQALAVSAASDDQIKQDQAIQRAIQRERARRRNF
jgi:hypothetical protein